MPTHDQNEVAGYRLRRLLESAASLLGVLPILLPVLVVLSVMVVALVLFVMEMSNG